MKKTLVLAVTVILLVTSCSGDDRATTVEAPDTTVTTSARLHRPNSLTHPAPTATDCHLRGTLRTIAQTVDRSSG
ncbi:MAG: PBP1b-binding outer membrane lipoprotein LpoB, partial [Candidatus Aldehydirespiratoraceae bacterium]